MNARRIVAAAAFPCLCLMASPAAAQSQRAAYRPILSTLPPDEAPRQHFDLSAPATRSVRSTGLLESWEVDENTQFGIGRYGVGTIARQRSNMERDRMMERENRNIAGAGMRIRF